MSETPASPSTPPPGQTPLKPPAAPAINLRPPPPSGGLKPPPAPYAGPKPPPAAPLRAPITAAPAPAPVSAAKLPERPAFVSPMPVIEEEDADSIPSFLPIVAGFAAAVSVAFAVLIFLKN